MALVLKVAAAVLALIGVVTLYWGTNPSLLSLGNTVMIVGAVIAAAGVVLFGLSAVVDQLGVVAAKLDDLRYGLAGPAPTREAVDEPLAMAPVDEAPAAPAPPVVAAAPASAAAPPPRDIVLDRLEDALMGAAPPPPAPAPVVQAPPAPPAPPSRQSFGLPPLAAQAPFATAAAAGLSAAAGLAAGAATSPAEARSAEKTPERTPAVEPSAVEPPTFEPPVIEPVRIEPVMAPPVRPAAPPPVVPPAEDLGDDGPFEAKGPGGVEKAPARPEEDPVLVHAVEDMKAEVKAAEADLAPTTPADPDLSDPMASLERLLLGASAADARAPAEPEPIASPLHRPALEPDEPEVAEEQSSFDNRREDDAEPAEPAPVEAVKDEEPAVSPTPPPPDADDFMARLRETISRPVAPPEVAPPRRPDPVVAPPVAAPPIETAPPPLSIEEELEKALQASLAETMPAPAPAPVEAPPVAAPRRLELVRPEPDAAPAVAPPPVDAMAALARDFPELNDILAPKKPAADPATSLIDDLKDIFEQPKAAPRQEPVVAAPPPPPQQPMPPLLREGVIAGIAFRLYGDGSIEADLPEGTTRFASLKDFRAHVGG
jgi:hypothetical protein